MSRLGIVGHRRLSAAATAFVDSASRTVLSNALATRSDVIALSALAEGADSLFAEAALALLVPLEVVRPFATYMDDFSAVASRRRYQSLAAAARKETKLRFAERSPRAYEAAMRWVVESCDILVAAWDGGPARGPGGTAHAVDHARRLGRPIIRLDVAHGITMASAT